MKKAIALALMSSGMIFAAQFTGVITDDMCAKANHKDMNMGSDEKCVNECIKSMHARYVLYDGRETYALSDQKAPAKFAAKRVTVTGTLDPNKKIIQVDKIEPAK